jgi:hypothetical protein
MGQPDRPGVPNLAEPAAQQPPAGGYWEGWIINENPADRDARVRAQALRDFAEVMRVLAEDAPADEPAKWPWSGYALAAVKAEEYAGKGFPCHEDSTAGDSGTPEHPEPRTGEERCSYCKTKDRDECEEGTNAG